MKWYDWELPFSPSGVPWQMNDVLGSKSPSSISLMMVLLVITASKYLHCGKHGLFSSILLANL